MEDKKDFFFFLYVFFFIIFCYFFCTQHTPQEWILAVDEVRSLGLWDKNINKEKNVAFFDALCHGLTILRRPQS